MDDRVTDLVTDLYRRKPDPKRVGGYNPTVPRLRLNHNVSFAELRLPIALGYRNVWMLHAELIRHESASWGMEDTPEKQARFALEARCTMSKWDDSLTTDSGYNANLDLQRQEFAPAFPPRAALFPEAASQDSGR